MAEEYDECGNLKDTKNCKYFHSDSLHTPNNYDLYIDYTGIPSNIEREDSVNLIKRLRKYMPLSKILHINMESESVSYKEDINIHTTTKIKFTRTTSKGGTENVVVNLK